MTKVLVIEDERPVRNNIVDLLKVEGFNAIGANNGLSGLQLVYEFQPDLIICDIIMPKLDGLELLKTLAQDPETAVIPCIFLSAKAERADIRQGMELGAYDYLTKPFTRDELLGTVRAQLQRRDAMTQSYSVKCEQVTTLKSHCTELQQISEAKDQLLKNLVQELREPLANLNLTVKMLKNAPRPEQRDRYLSILQEEFTREIALLNQVSDLQRLLTPDNIKLLTQFNLLQGDGTRGSHDALG